MRSSSRSGAGRTSSRSRSRSRRTSASRGEARSTTASERSATSSRTICCRCSRSPRWSRPREATTRSRGGGSTSSVRCRTPIPTHAVRGQYVGYREIEGVRPDSDTETFVALRLEIESWRWANVPDPHPRRKGATGERHRGRRSGSSACRSFAGGRTGSTRPAATTSSCASAATPASPSASARRLRVATCRSPSRSTSTSPRSWGSRREPYERLLADALRGDSTLFPRFEVIEETWRIVQPLLDSPPPLEPYERGTWGPESAEALAAEHGGWRDPAAPAARRDPRAARRSSPRPTRTSETSVGREEPVLDDAGCRLEELGERGRVARAIPIQSASTPPSGVRGASRSATSPSARERRREAEREQLERYRRARSRRRACPTRRSRRSARLPPRRSSPACAHRRRP